MTDYYFSKLSVSQQGMYLNVLDAMERRELTVCLNTINPDDVTKIFEAIQYDHPEIFFVDFHSGIYLETIGFLRCHINYFTGYDHTFQGIKDIEKKIDSIVALAQNENLKDDFERCRWIHNYLVKNVEYNDNALHNPHLYPDAFNVRGVFVKKKAVCEGVSKAFKVLCDRLNVDSIIVSGTLESGVFERPMPHAWNMVCIDGLFSHVDVTSDINISIGSKYTRYDNFCQPDEFIRTDHFYEGFPDCNTYSYSYFAKYGRFFINSRKLQEYLDAELKKNAKILYFQTKLPQSEKEAFKEKVRNQVIKSVNNSCKCLINDNQMCFLFRIKR